MRRIVKTRIALAIMGVLFLLFNPAGICAGTPDAQSASHPCCPKAPAPDRHDSATKTCVCIDRQSAVPSLAPLADSVQPFAASSDAVPLLVASTPAPEPRDAASPPHDRFVTFHQFLI